MYIYHGIKYRPIPMYMRNIVLGFEVIDMILIL